MRETSLQTHSTGKTRFPHAVFNSVLVITNLVILLSTHLLRTLV